MAAASEYLRVLRSRFSLAFLSLASLFSAIIASLFLYFSWNFNFVSLIFWISALRMFFNLSLLICSFLLFFLLTLALKIMKNLCKNFKQDSFYRVILCFWFNLLFVFSYRHFEDGISLPHTPSKPLFVFAFLVY